MHQKDNKQMLSKGHISAIWAGSLLIEACGARKDKA